MVSVIIPAYNSSATITRALDSVKNQTYKGSVEIIVINDGSSDSTKEILETYQLQNPTVSLKFLNQQNGGVSKARNAGLEIARGDYIAFLDSDDEWKEEKITEQINIFEKLGDEIDFLATAFEEVYLKNVKDKDVVKIKFTDLIFKNYFQPSTVMMKKKILHDVGFFREDQKYAEEGNYFMRIAYEFNCYFLNSKLIKYGAGKSGFGESGLSANLKEMERGELMNLKFIYNNKMISFPIFLIAYAFSLVKYVRRILMVKFRKYV